MLSLRLSIPVIALAAVFVTGAARAADYSQPLPPPQQVYVQPPQVEVVTSNWYLRGDIGVSAARNYQLDYLRNPLNTINFNFVSQSSSDSSFIGGGVGYEFNNWLRFDATAEYRSQMRVYAFGQYQNGGGTFLDTYEGYISSWVFLANAYVDLGTWNCFTPFVGFGIGGARVTMNNLTDVNPSLAGYGTGRNPSEWNFAWAIHAGVAYNVSKNFKVELAYRYLDYGSVTDTVDCANTCNPDSFKFGKLTSHDIKLGFRFLCCDTDVPAPRYVYQPEPYTPPPVYMQPPPPPSPPLRSRG